jgi:hypothetical protein
VEEGAAARKGTPVEGDVGPFDDEHNENMRFKKPKNSPYFAHCYQCKHYVFEKQVGCAYIGRCKAIKTDVTETDAYGRPCGLFARKEKR